MELESARQADQHEKKIHAIGELEPFDRFGGENIPCPRLFEIKLVDQGEKDDARRGCQESGWVGDEQALDGLA